MVYENRLPCSICPGWKRNIVPVDQRMVGTGGFNRESLIECAFPVPRLKCVANAFVAAKALWRETARCSHGHGHAWV
jgi:hypothetical protein